MIRRSIVDLSLDPSPADNKSVSTNSVSSSKKGQQQRRLVASKRKPCSSASSSLNRTAKSTFPDKKRKLEDNNEECDNDEENEELFVVKKQKTGNGAVAEAPGSRIAVKEFRRRCCAVYEPAVTLRALSAIQPTFFVGFFCFPF